MLDRHQLSANHTDINTTVSSHLRGIAAQGCRRVSKGRAKPTAELLLFRYAATAGDRAQGQEQRQRGTGGSFTAAQDTTHSKGRGGG